VNCRAFDVIVYFLRLLFQLLNSIIYIFGVIRCAYMSQCCPLLLLCHHVLIVVMIIIVVIIIINI